MAFQLADAQLQVTTVNNRESDNHNVQHYIQRKRYADSVFSVLVNVLNGFTISFRYRQSFILEG